MKYLYHFMQVYFKHSTLLLINYSCVCFVQVSSNHLAGSNSGSPGSDSLDAELFFDLEDGGTDTCNQTEEQLNQVNGGIGGNSPADSEDDEDKVINRYGRHLNTNFFRLIYE